MCPHMFKNINKTMNKVRGELKNRKKTNTLKRSDDGTFRGAKQAVQLKTQQQNEAQGKQNPTGEKNTGKNHCQGISLMKTMNPQIKEVQQTQSE